MFGRFRKQFVDFKTMNQHLKYCYNNRQILFRAKEKNETFGIKAFIEDCEVQFKLTYRRGSKPCTYIFRKDGDTSQVIDGGEAFRILSLYYKVPHVDEKYCGRYDEGGMSASPWLYKNDKYEGTRNKAYSYDLNSAYSFGMLQKMPDTSKEPQAKQIIEGKEIGFKEVPKPHDPNNVMLVPMYKGYSLYTFPLIESPFKKFVETWYNKKLNPDTKNKAKGVLNSSIGYLQKVNPFLRATIIGYCNEFIKSKMDENTLYCNTDSLVSLVKRDDFKIGTNIGEWKIDHEGLFAYKKYNYQWDFEKPHYRGKSRNWFKDGYDLLKDPPPTYGNIYKFNKNKYQLEEV